MSALFIIAGPPGIGKSTSGDEFINPGLDILNEDEMRFMYKAKGYADYNEYSIHRVRDTTDADQKRGFCARIKPWLFPSIRVYPFSKKFPGRKQASRNPLFYR